MDAVVGLVGSVRAALVEVADAEKAEPMQRYMKLAMPYLGVQMPLLRTVVRPVVAAWPLPDRSAWEAAVRTLYAEASHREERYAALEVAGHRLYRAHRDVEALPLFAWLIAEGAWWDLVDWTAGLVDEVLLRDPGAARPVVREWATADDLWLRRVAIISQLKVRGETDLDLLTHAIDANLEGTPFGHEFFIRKAIGWALRQHARTDPDWVRSFVASRGERLSGLSRREALKHLVGPDMRHT